MAPLPKGFSLQALPVERAISEGRSEDAKTLIIELLRAGKADRIVQGLAADMLRPPKRPRGRQKTLPKFWIEIGEEFGWLRADGVKYEEALTRLAEKFGYSETTIRTAVAFYEDGRYVHNEASSS